MTLELIYGIIQVFVIALIFTALFVFGGVMCLSAILNWFSKRKYRKQAAKTKYKPGDHIVYDGGGIFILALIDDVDILRPQLTTIEDPVFYKIKRIYETKTTEQNIIDRAGVLNYLMTQHRPVASILFFNDCIEFIEVENLETEVLIRKATKEEITLFGDINEKE